MLKRSLLRNNNNNNKNRIIKHLSSAPTPKTTPIAAARLFSTAPKMAFFQRNFYPETSFTPLFRLLQDFDDYSRQSNGGSPSGRRTGIAPWQPKFDVRETDSAYELHGELPGMNKDNVNIEFTDSQTLVVHGRVERTYTAGTPPSGYLEGSKTGGAITEGGEKEKKPPKPTVEDEGAAGKSGEKQVSKKGEEKDSGKPADNAKYWLSERSVGEFSRTFSFPTRIDQDKVSANFKDGILNITIPKAAKHEPKKIPVN
ncbi:30 kDa heat shock protein [Trichoderma ghanense]|uniref:30 kDa heat shock protein n=1 Tax=Trichoderma ghanense TaxID=65468 RepID=A0ABY2GVJ1_9HYPO